MSWSSDSKCFWRKWLWWWWQRWRQSISNGSPARSDEVLSTASFRLCLSFNTFQVKESCKYFPMCYSCFKYYFTSSNVTHSLNAVLIHFKGRLADGHVGNGILWLMSCIQLGWSPAQCQRALRGTRRSSLSKKKTTPLYLPELPISWS